MFLKNTKTVSLTIPGGRRRAGDPDKGDWTRDLPKYTQIGNAVPVKLAYEIGKHLKDLIK